MSSVGQLEAQVTQARAQMARLDRLPGDLTDQQVEEFCRLSDLVKDTEALIADERQKMRQSLDVGRAYQPQDRSESGPGALILAGEPRSYQKMFGAPPRAQWKAGEFLRVVLNGLHDPRLQFFSAMNEGPGASGGLLVPQELQSKLLDRAISQSIVLSRANISPMTSKTKIVAGFSATDQSQTMYGFTFQWLSELQTVTPGSGQLRAIELVAKLAGIYVSCSNELLSDAVGFEAELTARLGDAMAQELDAAFLNGSGVGQPLGILKSAALYVTPKETGQLAGSLVSENILRMLSHSTNAAGSVWIASPSCLPQLGMLVINVGTQAISSTLVTQGADGSLALAGRPLLLSHRLPVLGQQGDLSLVDLSQYVVGLRSGVGIESSGAPGFTSNAMTFRCLTRIDGQPVILGPYLGEDARSYSPFVSLQART